MSTESDESDFFMLGQYAHECAISLEEMLKDLDKRFEREFSNRPPTSFVRAMTDGWFSMKQTKHNGDYDERNEYGY